MEPLHTCGKAVQHLMLPGLVRPQVPTIHKTIHRERLPPPPGTEEQLLPVPAQEHRETRVPPFRLQCCPQLSIIQFLQPRLYATARLRLRLPAHFRPAEPGLIHTSGRAVLHRQLPVLLPHRVQTIPRTIRRQEPLRQPPGTGGL